MPKYTQNTDRADEKKLGPIGPVDEPKDGKPMRRRQRRNPVVINKNDASTSLPDEDICRKHNELILKIEAVPQINDPQDERELGQQTIDKIKIILAKECERGYVQKQDPYKSTILHKLGIDINDNHDNDRNREIAIIYLLKNCPDLLHTKDWNEKTPFSQAIENRDQGFLETVLINIPPDQQTKVLTSNDGGGLTCLNLAFKRHTGDNEFLDMLLEYTAPIVFVTPDQKGNTPLHYLVQNQDFDARSLMGYLTKLLDQGPGAIEMANTPDNDTPYQARQNFLKKNDGLRVVKGPVTKGQNAESQVSYKFKKDCTQPDNHGKVLDEVSESLKKCCMMKGGRVERFLYKPGEERSVYLDLTSYSKQTIADEDLEYIESPNFETILQFVRIPQICIDLTSEDDKPTFNSRHKGHREQRRDVEHVFSWLREKGVKTILEVDVMDLGCVKPNGGTFDCHSDEVIEKALDGFGVVTWDWKRYDICSGTIATAAPEVEELYLYSRGNPAVLFSWSCDDGLGTLKKLRTVHLTIHPDLDSKERTKINITQFEKRMEKLERKVEYKVTFDFKTGGSDSGSSHSEQSPEGWLHTMKNWAHFTTIHSEPPTARKRGKPVVAILDDGVDVTRDEIKDRLIGGQSFKTAASGKHFCGHQGSPNSHGTLMACKVLEMCPQATILPIRLDTRDSPNGSLCFTIKSAAEAIEWAVLQKVDIISMSWSIESPVQPMDNKTKDDINSLELAISKAAQEKIILFCATSDRGSSTSDTLYPGCISPVIKIGAATSTGDVSTKVLSHNVDYIFPGEAITVDGKTTADGSSISTALAAGMAAMLLFCVEQVVPEDGRKDYYTNAAIRRAFRKMGADESCAPKVEAPYNWVDTDHQNSEIWRSKVRTVMMKVGLIEIS